MKVNVKLLLYFVAIAFLICSCEKDDEELPVSQPVSDVNIVAKNQMVEVSWENPTNELYQKSVLRYGDQEVELEKDQNYIVLENLTNGVEYSIEIISIDSNGTESEPVVVTATPDQFVTTYEGKDAFDGTYYREADGLRYKVEVSGSNLNYIMGTMSHYEWFFEGEVSNISDTSFVHDYVYSADPVYDEKKVISEGKDLKSNEFCIEIDDEVFYVRYGYKKISGDSSFLPGKYRRFYNDNYPEDEGTVSFYAEFDESGDGRFWTEDPQTEDTNESLVTWDNDQLLAGDYIFAEYKNEIYLISRDRDPLLKKQ